MTICSARRHYASPSTNSITYDDVPIMMSPYNTTISSYTPQWHHNITPWSAPYHNECLTSQWHYCSTVILFWLHNESILVNRLAPLELAPRTADPGPSIGPVYLFPLDLSMLTCPLALCPRSPIPWHHTICFGLLCLTSHYVIPFHHPHIMP